MRHPRSRGFISFTCRLIPYPVFRVSTFLHADPNQKTRHPKGLRMLGSGRGVGMLGLGKGVGF